MNLDIVPLWGLCLATVAIVLMSVELGFRLGRYRRQQGSTENEGPVGSMVSATLALLAFLLAFTFSLAASRFESRRELVVEEANAIGTVYLRAGLLPAAEGQQIRHLLRDYLSTRLTLRRLEHVPDLLTKSQEIHTQLWRLAEHVSRDTPQSVPTGLFVKSLNELIDLHATRVSVGLYSRIPEAIWAVLLLLSMLAIGATGYQEGLSSSHRTPVTLALILSFAGVIYLIADLDRPHEGLLNASQRSMFELQQSFDSAG